MQDPSYGKPVQRANFELHLTNKSFDECFYNTKKEDVLEFLDTYDTEYGHMELHYKHHKITCGTKGPFTIRELLQDDIFGYCECPQPTCICYVLFLFILEEIFKQMDCFFPNHRIYELHGRVGTN